MWILSWVKDEIHSLLNYLLLVFAARLVFDLELAPLWKASKLNQEEARFPLLSEARFGILLSKRACALDQSSPGRSSIKRSKYDT